MNSIQTGDCTSQKKGKSYIRVVHYFVEKFYKHICECSGVDNFEIYAITSYKMLSSNYIFAFKHSKSDIYGPSIIFRITRNIHK